MTQTAMIRGFARWAEKNMTQKLQAGGAIRIVFSTFTRLAETAPGLALNMLLAKYPQLEPIAVTVKDAATFAPTWQALADSVDENGGLPIDIREPMPFGHVHSFRLRKPDLDAIRAEMEKAYMEEAAAARAVAAAGGGQAK